MSVFREAPMVFRTPTSLALFEALAVARLTKLMHEIIRSRRAAARNIRTYSILPPETSARSLKSLYKNDLQIFEENILLCVRPSDGLK